MAGDWFNVIALSYVCEVATATFLESVAGLSNILQTAFFTANDVYIIIFVLQLKRPFMSIFSLVFHEMISVFCIYGQAAYNFPQGELLFSINWGFMSVGVSN